MNAYNCYSPTGDPLFMPFNDSRMASTNEVEVVEGGDTNEVETAGGDASGLVGCDVLVAPQPASNGTAFFCGCGPLGTTAPTVAVRPYRLESVATNDDISYVMPSNGEVRGTWHQTGAYEDVQKVELLGSAREDASSTEAFRFPLGTNLCESMWVYTGSSADVVKG